MTATPPKASLVKTPLAVATATSQRLSALLPTVPSQYSPVTVYQAGNVGVGSQLIAPTSAFPAGAGYYGVWTAPDLNNGKPYVIQVECFGGGGGGGGGSTACGGGGGGGGEYAAEVSYPVKPGQVYAWQVGVPGSPGVANSNNAQAATAGGTGGITRFDIAGLGVAGGVVANGGLGGDVGNTGNGGNGGAGSINTTEFAGGAGGTNVPGGGGGSGGQGGTDNPIALFTAGFLTKTPSAWYLMNDFGTLGQLNDNTGKANVAAPGSFLPSGLAFRAAVGSPSQVPAYAGPANPPSWPNQMVSQTSIYWVLTQLTQVSGYVVCPALGWDGATITYSCWVTPDPSGTWGNTASGSRSVIVANCEGYYNSSTAGTALYFKQNGTPSNPNWTLNFYCSDGSSPSTLSVSMPPVVGTPNQVVITFNNGAMKLYVNGSQVASTTAAFTVIPTWPTVPYAPNIGCDPQLSRDWFFGYMANAWFSSGVLSAAGVTQAFSGTGSSTGGGAGGGASGGPAAAGGTGAAGAGSAGGAGGTPATQPTADIGINSPANAGIAGAASGSGNSGITGGYGAGGGGAGESTTPPAVNTITVPFITASTYAGTDAQGGAAGTVYNPVIQGISGRLFTGGTSKDAASGSKNSLLILPPNLPAQLSNGNWTVTRVTLTVFNANTQASQNALMQVGWSNDTFLPITYTAGDIAGSAGVVEIPLGASQVTVDLTESQIGSYLQAGTATALVLGPGPSPTFAAYNASTAGDFYTAIYGPGAVDNAGNSLAPYLTVTYAQSTTVQQGSPGGAGGILLTYLNQAQALVGTWNAASGINAQGGQLTETTLVLGSTLVNAARLGARATGLVGEDDELDSRQLDMLQAGIEKLRASGRLGAIMGAPGTVLGYVSTPTTVTQSTPGNYTFTVPASVTSLNVQCWGGGGGGIGGSSSVGQGGGGGGAYAGEPSYAVTPGQVLHYTVGAGGTGQNVGVNTAANGGNTVFDSTNVAGKGVTAIGGFSYQSALNYGPGGSVSGNTVAFAGGNGGPITAFQSNGSGGGGSAGAAGTGFGGSSGGGAGSGGGGGGASGGAGHSSGSNGSNGSVPGGGGGGAGKGTSSHHGGNGAAGEVSITYISATTLTNSIATAAGTDVVGNAYPTGMMTNALQVNGTAAATTVTASGNVNASGNVTASGTVSGNTLSGTLNAGFVSGTVANANVANSVSGLSIPQGVSGWPLSGNPPVTTTGLLMSNGVQNALNSIYNALVNAGII